MKKGFVITIDGPAGAGKSTVAKALSHRLSYIYLDTGALYRVVAYKMIQVGISRENREQLEDLCPHIKINLKYLGGRMRVMVDDEDVTDKLRTEEIGLIASKVSAIPLVREILLQVQRESGKNGGIIAEGRDTGTVIFPHADVKFFMDATVEERVERRYRELLERGDRIDYQEIKRDLIRRDRQDRERKIAPLIPSADAVIIDTTRMSVTDVLETMISVIKSRQ
ncbi:MAG: (d)CMP kinase [Deltaproteobacteria bacterium]|nr:(d)CMP kinase [Deltaproteobacteria bacterium]